MAKRVIYIKHFMTDYAGLLAYSDWLRDEGKEEEALAFLNAVAEERGWSESEVGSNNNGYGHGYGYGDENGNGYSYSRNSPHYDSTLGHGYGDGNVTSIVYGFGNGDGYSGSMQNHLYPTEE